MGCTDQKCRLDIEQRLHKEISDAKDLMSDDLKDERLSLYSYVNEKYADVMNKMDLLRKEVAVACGKVADTIYIRTKGYISFSGFFTALAIVVTIVGIFVGVFMTITTRANDRTNIATDKRITEIEKSDHLQEQTITEIEITLGEIRVAIENLNKTTEDLKNVIERQKGFPAVTPSTNTVTKENLHE